MDQTITPWFSEGLRFQCTGCGQCCTKEPGYVFLSLLDLEKLSDHFQISPQDFLKKYTRLVDDRYALLEDLLTYDCVFLKNNACTVYESRPIQCRTFPWWVQNLRTPSDWKEASLRCEGINHPTASLIPALKIEEECMTYLDSLLDQNFSL